VRVIASSVRKGNILEIDSKLFVVLTAESEAGRREMSANDRYR
jgi:translation elongation factor P/translation initiation factor 5A